MQTGWDNFQAATVPLRQSLTISVRIFSVVLISAMALAAFLYLLQRRKDFAILRSMGVPKGSAIRQLVWSMAVIGTIGVAAGGVVSWGYALGKAARTLASLQGPKAADLSANLSPAWLVGLCAVAVIVLFSFTVAGASSMSRRPVLELLQGTESRAVRKRKPAADTEGVDGGGHSERAPVTLPQTAQVVLAPATRNPALALSSRYALRHTRRALSKSILAVSVALGFTLALGWLSWSIERNEAKLDGLYRATEVEAEIVKTNPSLVTGSRSGGFIPSGKVDAVLETGFVKDAYLEATSVAPWVGALVTADEIRAGERRVMENVRLLGFSQPEWFFLDREGHIAVEYAEGWDESLFAKDWTLGQSAGQLPAVLPLAVMSNLRLRLGDSVWLQESTSTHSMNCTVAGQ